VNTDAGRSALRESAAEDITHRVFMSTPALSHRTLLTRAHAYEHTVHVRTC
jgi:hypothetical protein